MALYPGIDLNTNPELNRWLQKHPKSTFDTNELTTEMNTSHINASDWAQNQPKSLYNRVRA